MEILWKPAAFLSYQYFHKSVLDCDCDQFDASACHQKSEPPKDTRFTADF